MQTIKQLFTFFQIDKKGIVHNEKGCRNKQQVRKGAQTWCPLVSLEGHHQVHPQGWDGAQRDPQRDFSFYIQKLLPYLGELP